MKTSTIIVRVVHNSDIDPASFILPLREVFYNRKEVSGASIKLSLRVKQPGVG
jgi:hypothetical protein